MFEKQIMRLTVEFKIELQTFDKKYNRLNYLSIIVLQAKKY